MSKRQPREGVEEEQSKQQDQSVLRPSDLGVSADKDRGMRWSRSGLDHVMHHSCGEQCGFYSEHKREAIGGFGEGE